MRPLVVGLLTAGLLLAGSDVGTAGTRKCYGDVYTADCSVPVHQGTATVTFGCRCWPMNFETLTVGERHRVVNDRLVITDSRLRRLTISRWIGGFKVRLIGPATSLYFTLHYRK